MRNSLGVAALIVPFLILFITQSLIWAPTAVWAEDILLQLSLTSSDDAVHVLLENQGQQSIHGLKIEVDLVGRKYSREIIEALPPKRNHLEEFQVQIPKQRGSYPLLASVSYLNLDQEMSLVSVGTFRVGVDLQAEQGATCMIPDLTLHEYLTLPVYHSKELKPLLHLPKELVLEKREKFGGGTFFSIKNTRPNLSAQHTVHAVLRHSTIDSEFTSCSAKILAPRVYKKNATVPPWLYFLSALLGLLASRNSLFRLEQSKQTMSFKYYVKARWGFSLFVISCLLLTFFYARIIPDFLIPLIPFQSLKGIEGLNALLELLLPLLEVLYFDGLNYDYFAAYAVLPLFFYFLVFNYFVLSRFVLSQDGTDKYWYLMLLIYKKIPFLKLQFDNSIGEVSDLNEEIAKLALRSLCVKLFFAPLLFSWTINNIFHLAYLSKVSIFEFSSLCQLLISIMIFIDVFIFCLGYFTELPRFGNVIRSVDTSLLGVSVCLVCYPPFNQFFFSMLDIPLHEHWGTAARFHLSLAEIFIVLLWFFYLWATAALGLKASNLTNRGIVSHGPYAFVRHPAYVSKVLVWIVTAAVLGTMNFFLVCTLVAIYSLRALTEERHLGKDPTYREYCEAVPWRILPGII